MKKIIIILFVFAVVGFGCQQKIAQQNGEQAQQVNTPAKNTNQQQTNTTTMNDTKPQAPTATSAEDIQYSKATFKTSMGDFTVAFYPELAPKTVQNFQNLAASGFYDGVKFHRVMQDFMIQGGDPLSKNDIMELRWGTGGPGYTFADEINNKKLVRGSLAMANAGANTNGSQFFVVTKESTPWLDGAHTNFGEVVDGIDVVMAIEAVETDGADRPLEPVVIEAIELIK